MHQGEEEGELLVRVCQLTSPGQVCRFQRRTNRVKEVKGARLVNPQVTPVSSYVLGVYFFGTGECHDSLYDAKPF